MTTKYSKAYLAQILKVAPWQITYAIKQGFVPAPKKIRRRYLYTDADLAALKTHFAECPISGLR